jgi:hypothetical protein
LTGLRGAPETTVSLVGREHLLVTEPRARGIVVAIPDDLADSPAHALRIAPVPDHIGP